MLWYMQASRHGESGSEEQAVYMLVAGYAVYVRSQAIPLAFSAFCLIFLIVQAAGGR